MTIALKSADSLTAHAVCMAAGIRDGMRTAQFYVRDMTNADRLDDHLQGKSTVLSRVVAGTARGVDQFLSKGAEICIRLLLPQWRNLPSPFAPGMRGEVLEAIQQNRLVLTSLFTAYFFRAGKHILETCTIGPYLVLEHRVDAARRLLAEAQNGTNREPTAALGLALLHLVEADPIARMGRVKANHKFLSVVEANVAVMAAACVALLLAEDGKPLESLDEDEFFAIAGALLAPRLPAMADAITARDAVKLGQELAAVRDLY